MCQNDIFCVINININFICTWNISKHDVCKYVCIYYLHYVHEKKKKNMKYLHVSYNLLWDGIKMWSNSFVWKYTRDIIRILEKEYLLLVSLLSF